MRSMGSPRAVSMMTGVLERARRSRHSVRPSSRGRLRGARHPARAGWGVARRSARGGGVVAGGGGGGGGGRGGGGGAGGGGWGRRTPAPAGGGRRARVIAAPFPRGERTRPNYGCSK